MKLSLINIIHAIVVWQSFLFAVVLLTPKFYKLKSNRFLSLLLFTLALHFSYNLMYTNGFYVEVLSPYSYSYGLLYGPFIFFYVRFHLLNDAKFKTIDWFHFSPFCFYIIFTFSGYRPYRVMDDLLLPIMLFYCVLSFKTIYSYNKTLPYVSAKNRSSQAKWLYSIVFLMFAITLLNLLQFYVNRVRLMGIEFSLEALVQLSVLLWINLILYNAIKNPQTFQRLSYQDFEIGKFTMSKRNLDKNQISDLEKVAEKIERHMSTESPYLNPDLSISDFSNAIGIHPKVLSQAINNVIGYNFCDYVNSYRIRLAKEKLKKNSKETLSIKEVMYDTGFNSRSVFNTAFKSKTGITPSEYRKKHRKS
ncbi:MAG: helix-turn-helix domain-containing protein [Bacteroidota bacterium]